MSVGAKFKDKLGKIKAHLTSLDDQQLGKAALVIILFLDIFILIAIFNGLDEHTRQLSSPDAYIPNACREIVINRHWNPTNRTDNLSQIVVSASNSYYQNEEKRITRHPLCVPYIDLFDQIKNDKALTRIFEERNKSEREAKILQREINELKGAYDTTLLETIAKQQESQTKIDSINNDFQQKTSALNILKNRIASLELTINGDAKVKMLWERLQGLQEQDRQKLISDLRNLNFWYPVKRLGMQMIFLLPLFAVFYAWNNASIRKNRGVQTLVSSHLLGVSFIPIFCKIIETVYDIIPKILLKKIIDLLESLKLVAIWHYLVIALAATAALLLIYVFQKKLFSNKKLIERRISKGECQHCGKHLPAGAQACPFCGYAQFKSCSNCNKLMHVHGKYCMTCGFQQTESRQQ
ncbi:MAG: zinc ribbon domain-containing protein [Desulfatirhabdiaceae bacterium]|nr:zinc ribbon domain-containing protein [Desulfatirhabdiaceae bacterium]